MTPTVIPLEKRTDCEHKAVTEDAPERDARARERDYALRDENFKCATRTRVIRFAEIYVTKKRISYLDRYATFPRDFPGARSLRQSHGCHEDRRGFALDR